MENELTSSEKIKRWSDRFLENLEKELSKNKENEIKITLGGSKKKEYILLRENIRKILDYTDYLVSNSYTKKTSAVRVANYLIYFCDITRKPFKQIERKDIEKFFIHFQKNSENYKALLRRVIKPFFRWVYGGDRGGEYPPIVAWINTSLGANDEKLPDILSMDEIQKMIDEAFCSRDKALISVLYDSGCRTGELLDIKLKDLDKEIKDLENEMLKRTEELHDVSKNTAIKKLKGKLGEEETSYIG